ncbi:MAG TPA: glycosyltransferase, partial [Rhodocyclaceae bacterium]|nr:glycosyltransferase [Rhodocyclaceae bacterium]
MATPPPLLAALGIDNDTGKGSASALPIDERHLLLLLEAQRIGRIGNWERDLLTNQLWWSDECYRLFDLTPGTVVPTPSLFFQQVHPDDRERVANAMTRGHTLALPYQIEFRVLLSGGECRQMLIHGRTTLGKDGVPLRASGTCQDITETQKAELLNRAWVFATPSRFEGWCIAAVEAQACRVPVVATTADGFLDSVRDGETGILVPNDEQTVRADLADAVSSLLADPARRVAMGEAAH